MIKQFLGAVAVSMVAMASAANAGTILISGPGFAGATLTATSAAGATSAPFTLGNFGNAGTNGLVSTAPISFQGGSISFANTSSTPLAGVYDGSTNVAHSVFDGTGLASGNYLVAEPNNSVVLNYNNTQFNFALLWGTVDTGNSLNLDFRNDTNSVFRLTVTGSQVASAAGHGFMADGTTSAFVSLAELPGFNQIVATSSNIAFEFDPSVRVPEPASIALLGAGLAGIGMIRRRKTAA